VGSSCLTNPKLQHSLFAVVVTARVYSKQIHLQAREKVCTMPRLKKKWLEKEKQLVATIPVSVVAPITPQYLNIEQASAYLSVTTWTIRRLIDNKELSCAKIGKRFIVKREDLDNIWEKKAEAA